MTFGLFVLCLCLWWTIEAADPPHLPRPNHDIPSDIYKSLNNARVDYHGWQLLPIDRDESTSKDAVIEGYFYHHTPEFWHESPHDFELMAFGKLHLANSSFFSTFPFPPSSANLGTEYVFTPPAFSLDEFILGTLPYEAMDGKFTNGSFDTDQRYLLSEGHLEIVDIPTVKYLNQTNTVGYKELPYLSYPRNIGEDQSTLNGENHIYLLHYLEAMPEFDQIVHGIIRGCQYRGTDSVKDVLIAGATFVFPGIANDINSRLSPLNSVVIAELQTKNDNPPTICKIEIVEELHCVKVPDSFEKCPELLKNK